MRSSADPSIHREREQQAVAHIERVLADERLRIDTIDGSRLAKTLMADVVRTDNGVDLKRLMSTEGVPDRELESQMPVGAGLEVTFSQKKMLVMKKPVARLKVVCISPTKALLRGGEIKPVGMSELQKVLSAVPPPLGGVPTTLIVVSTSGFTIESHELVDRRADRILVLMEPTDAGGWAIHGPSELRALADLLDPEDIDAKRQRLREAIRDAEGELLTSGITAEKIAGRTGIALQMVEAELKSYAKANPGLAAKRLDGRMVVYREGTMPDAVVSASGGSDMPLLDRVKALFSRRGETEKKIAFLSERKTGLALQRDKAYEDLAQFEKQEAMLKRQFKEAAGAITKKRVTQQLLQLRKDVERRQQMIDVLNRQINVVSTHLHNLELVQQGQKSELPDTDEITADAVAAEEMLAELEANAELAESIGGTSAVGKMSAEEQALYEELERETGNSSAIPNTEAARAQAQPTPAGPAPEQAPPRADPSAEASPRPAEPEAG